MHRKDSAESDSTQFESNPRTNRFLAAFAVRGPWPTHKRAMLGPFPAQHMASGLRWLRVDRPESPPPGAAEALQYFCGRYGATERTWRRWSAQPHATLVQLLALHHELDPDALRMEQATLAHVHSLPALYAHIPGDPVGAFVKQLHALRGMPMARMFWPTTTRPGADPWHWTMAFDQFERCFAARTFARIGFEPSQQNLEAPPPNTYTTQLYTQLERLREEMRPVADGGTYEPGRWESVLDVEAFFDTHMPTLEPSKRRVFRMLLCPDGLRGRQARSTKFFRGKGVPTGLCVCSQCTGGRPWEAGRKGGAR